MVEYIFYKNKDGRIIAKGIDLAETMELSPEIESDEYCERILEALLKNISTHENIQDFNVSIDEASKILVKNEIVKNEEHGHAILQFLVQRRIYPVKKKNIELVTSYDNVIKAVETGNTYPAKSWTIFLVVMIDRLKEYKKGMAEAFKVYKEAIKQIPEATTARDKAIKHLEEYNAWKKKEQNVKLSSEEKKMMDESLYWGMYYDAWAEDTETSKIFQNFINRLNEINRKIDVILPRLNIWKGELEAAIKIGNIKQIKLMSKYIEAVEESCIKLGKVKLEISREAIRNKKPEEIDAVLQKYNITLENADESLAKVKKTDEEIEVEIMKE